VKGAPSVQNRGFAASFTFYLTYQGGKEIDLLSFRFDSGTQSLNPDYSKLKFYYSRDCYRGNPGDSSGGGLFEAS